MEYNGIYLPVEILFQVAAYNPSPSLLRVNTLLHDEITAIYRNSIRQLLSNHPGLEGRVAPNIGAGTPPMRHFMELMREIHGMAKHLGCDMPPPQENPTLIQMLDWDYSRFRSLSQEVNEATLRAKREDFKTFVAVVAEALSYPVPEDFNPQEVWDSLQGQPGFDTIEELNFTRKGIKFLPPEIARFTQLTRLYLDGNELRSLPGEMAALICLQRLYINNNKLEWIPDTLSLPELQYLELRSNRLKKAPDLANFPRLRVVHMHKNQVDEMPSMQNAHPLFQRIYLIDNPVSRMPNPSPQKIVLRNENIR